MKLTQQTIIKSILLLKNVNKKVMFKPFYTKKIILILIIFLFNCKNKVEVTDDATVVFNNKFYRATYPLYEFEYKNHTYISCKVSSGISVTHAGHCKCSIK